MGSVKQKFYVVWQGKQTGIFTSWAECEAQVKGVEGAKYKSFPTRAEAEAALAGEPPVWRKKGDSGGAAVLRKNDDGGDLLSRVAGCKVKPVLPALAVDAACSGNPGPMEYRGVDLATGQEVFHFGPVHGTNNIGEFLAIVHALALLKQQGRTMTVYSDSRNALLWVKARKCRTKLARTARTEQLFQLIERAETWLNAHNFADIPLLKWKTSQWGEVPADFGRK